MFICSVKHNLGGYECGYYIMHHMLTIVTTHLVDSLKDVRKFSTSRISYALFLFLELIFYCFFFEIIGAHQSGSNAY